MHRLIQDHLEEVLANASLPAGHPVPAHLAACAECREEVDAMQMQSELLRSWSLAGDVPEVEPRPGFYARVLERIEAQRPVSIWALFTDSVVGRRLAMASLAMAMLTGVYAVTGESSFIPQAQASAQAQVDPLYPSATFATDVMAANATDGSAVFVSLVSYRER